MSNPTSINVNDTFTTKKGETFTVTSKSDRKDYWNIKFNGEDEYETHASQIVSGFIPKRYSANYGGNQSRNKTGINVGDVITSEHGGDFTVISKAERPNFWNIKFNDVGGYETTVDASQIYRRSVANLNKATRLGVGYLGVGPYKGSFMVDGVRHRTKEFESWSGMLKRCYCPKTQERQPSYKGCTVHPVWHNFQVFAKWYTEQPGYAEGWDLDKDLLVEGNKVYGPDTCVLLPRQINSLVTMVDMLEDRFLPRGMYIRQNGTYRVELGSLATKRSTVTVKTLEEAIKLRNQNTIERIGEIVDVYSDKIPEHVMSIIKKRLYKLLWIPPEEDSASN